MYINSRIVIFFANKLPLAPLKQRGRGFCVKQKSGQTNSQHRLKEGCSGKMSNQEAICICSLLEKGKSFVSNGVILVVSTTP